MILYDFRCVERHRFEAGVASMTSPNPACPECGAETRRILSPVRIGGAADAGPSHEEMPNTWRSIGGGHPDAVAHWRKKIERREKLEESYPELAGDRRPILAHEGIFQGRPLRVGDDIGAAVQAAKASNSKSGTSGTPHEDS